MSKTDTYWMRRALVLARKGIGTTQPNPMVGAIVLDKNGLQVGAGFHVKAGEPHAEVFALKAAGEKARGGTLYVTLEPCSHHGRTPPCVDRILESGVARVVIATQDSNPLVAGQGIAKLKKSGVAVDVGILGEQALRMNLPFFTSIEKKRPMLTAKVAVTADGKIGLRGERLMISNPICEKTTMRLRANAGAILIGINTLLTDDPLLTVRGKYSSRTPVRAILDPDLRTPLSANIFSDPGGPVWIFCRSSNTPSSEETRKKVKVLLDRGVVLYFLEPDSKDQLPEEEILSKFEDEGIISVLLEGGSSLFTRFMEKRLIDRWYFYVSPKSLGTTFEGKETLPLFNTSRVGGPAANAQLENIDLFLNQTLGAPGDYHFTVHSAIRRGLDLEVVAS